MFCSPWAIPLTVSNRASRWASERRPPALHRRSRSTCRKPSEPHGPVRTGFEHKSATIIRANARTPALPRSGAPDPRKRPFTRRREVAGGFAEPRSSEVSPGPEGDPAPLLREAVVVPRSDGRRQAWSHGIESEALRVLRALHGESGHGERSFPLWFRLRRVRGSGVASGVEVSDHCPGAWWPRKGQDMGHRRSNSSWMVGWNAEAVLPPERPSERGLRTTRVYTTSSGP